MEHGLTGSVDGLLQLGLPGIVIIGLLFAVWRLARRYDDVQEKRITEAREGIKAIEQNSASLEHLAEVIRTRREA